MKRVFLIIFLVFLGNTAFAVDFFVSEEMQVRMLQIDALPLMFSNVTGAGVKATDGDIKLAVSASLLLSGMSVQVDSTSENISSLAYGVGGAATIRLGFVRILSIKSEISSLFVSNDSANINISELGVDFGVWFESPSGKYDITLDLIRLGVRPGGITNSWIEGYEGPFYISFYPSLGVMFLF